MMFLLQFHSFSDFIIQYFPEAFLESTEHYHDRAATYTKRYGPQNAHT